VIPVESRIQELGRIRKIKYHEFMTYPSASRLLVPAGDAIFMRSADRSKQGEGSDLIQPESPCQA
jgi:hypothetical protein